MSLILVTANPAPRKNKTKELAEILSILWEKITDDGPVNLVFRGPRGGTNAKVLEGWNRSPSQTFTKACHEVGIPTMNWWDGSNPTPSTGVPKVLVEKYKKTNR